MSGESEARFKRPDRELSHVKPSFLKVLAIFRAIDSVLITACLWFSCMLLAIPFADSAGLVIVALIAYGLFAERCGVYDGLYQLSTEQLLYSVLIAWSLTSCILLLPMVAGLAPNTSPLLYALWLPFTLISLLGSHLVRRTLWIELRAKLHPQSRFAILGATPTGLKLAHTLNDTPWLCGKFVGFFDHTASDSMAEDNCKVETLDALYEQVRAAEIDTVYIALPASDQSLIQSVLIKLSDSTASTFLVPDIYSFDLLHSRVTTIKGIPALSIYDTPLSYHGFAKRCFDLFFSLLILLILALPMCVIALCVKMSSKGTVLFKQTRYGFGGEAIKVWKYRSMTVCEDGDVIVQANKCDTRITPLGAFLRKTSLDELPQLFNVIGGSMSLVGPRPHAVAHNEYYRGQIQGYMLRHKVKPGITGLAQVKGFRGETPKLGDMEGRIFYDLEYIRRWSHGLDIKIMFLTIFKGFVGQNAY